MKAVLWLLLIVSAFLAGLVLIFTLRDKDFFKQTITQIISGTFIALISFWSAYCLYRIQDNEKAKHIQIDSFIKVTNEISENRPTLERETQREKGLVRLPLKTEAWVTGKYQLPVKTPRLIDSLKLLYDDIEKYNWHVRFLHFKIMEQNLSTEKVPEQVWISLKNIDNKLISKLRELEQLTARELVILKKSSKREYEKHFGNWEDKTEMPYFKNQEKGKLST